MEVKKTIWEGAIPLQIHLHQSDVATLPPPPPALVLAPRLSYLPLLSSLIKPHFNDALPPSVDTIWFDFNALPLKWYIPTGVLYDLLCPEPHKPWNLTVHFTGYPSNVLIPYQGEDSVKWSFINSLKEAAYIITGNSKNIMNMSQSDQVELWQSVMNGSLEPYQRIASKLKLGVIEDEFIVEKGLILMNTRQASGETDMAGQVKTGRIPIRLYIWTVSKDFDDLEDYPPIDSWDQVSYLNRSLEIKKDGKRLSLHDALRSLLPEYTFNRALTSEQQPSEDSGEGENPSENVETHTTGGYPEIKLVRIQGIEPRLDIPFSWVVNNLMHPEYFLHICVCVKVPPVNAT
ncbi:hypothetical protein ACFE04_007616 [Oxalis oulophora]